MNGRTAKMLRRAAGVKSAPVAYDKPQIHHLSEHPVFETHVRTISEWGPPLDLPTNYKTVARAESGYRSYLSRPISGQRRRLVDRDVTKIRYSADGKTPLQPIIDMVRDPKTSELIHKYRTQLVPVAKPRRLVAGSPRRVYQRLKDLYHRVGLEFLMTQVEEGARA